MWCACVTTALFTTLALSGSLSDVCTHYIVPAFCYITFPLCVVDGGVAGDVRRRPQVRRLCWEDCLMLETRYCLAEYSDARRRDNPGSYYLLTYLLTYFAASTSIECWFYVRVVLEIVRPFRYMLFRVTDYTGQHWSFLSNGKRSL